VKLSYKIKIDQPSTHQVFVSITGKKDSKNMIFDLFLPRWSPGSYLMREYSRHISRPMAQTSNGEVLFFEQIDTSVFRIDWKKSEIKTIDDNFTFSYFVYAHELTVRTSHVDSSHAFLHLPSLLMGIVDQEITDPTIEISFPASWSKISTGLKDISTKREQFIYTAKNYDYLIDSPIEIGCQETDGFKAFGVDHDLAFYGKTLPHNENLKADMKKIVEHIAGFFGGVPYEKYTFITHFSPGLFGGLEHNNSTALHYCPTQLTTRKGYINFLALVSHEYFHTWNVKRIRPLEFGPFNYLKEATTKLLWLAEGLTSLMDELFIYRMKLITVEEYLEMQKDNLNRYYSVQGRRLHTLDDSSFNAWIKLYRPDENMNNSSISYYLKGGIVFFALNILFAEKNKSINDFLKLLWEDFNKNPERGLNPEQVYAMVESVGGKEIREKFYEMTSTTKEIDLESLCMSAGMKFEWEKSDAPWLGVDAEFNGDRVSLKAVTLDGPGYKAGLNAGDEIIAINGMRILKDRYNDYSKYLQVNKKYNFTVSRLSQLVEIELLVENAPSKLKAITVVDKVKLDKILGA
jgi:predicted metalloprotease with PDZ domain